MGLPASGKTVVFNALSRSKVPVATYSTPSSEPNRAVVKVPDNRLTALSEMFQPQKVTPAEVQYVDVAGITQGMSSDSQAAPLIARLRASDALLIVVRAFASEGVAHPLGSVDPERDLDVLATEMMLADLGVVEKRLERLEKEQGRGKATDAEKQAREREYKLLGDIRTALGDGRLACSVELTLDDEKLLRGFGFLTQKPWLIVLNTGDEGTDADLVGRVRARWEDGDTPRTGGRSAQVIPVAGRLEMDLAELSPEEATEFLEAWNVAEPALDRVIQHSYSLLDLISFFTVGEDEVRAWTINRGASAVDAASAIHTSIAKGFIRAEVVCHDELLECGSLAEARKRGKLRSEGRTYTVRDGDIAHFLHSA